MKFDLKALLNSFNYALNGIIEALKSEQNLRIHFLATVLVLILAWLLKISQLELLILSITITLVIGAEMFNTALEYLIDLCVDQFKREAQLAKDIGAGAVLITAINAVFVAYLIFFKRLTELLIPNPRYADLILAGLLLGLLVKVIIQFLRD